MTTDKLTGAVTSDSQWIRQAFFIPGTTSKAGYKNNKYRDIKLKGQRFTSAELKYTDTTPGGNFAMNPKPQFTRWCDPKEPGLARSSRGQGEYYSSAIDDNAQRIHMQFGVPEYNSLTAFYTNFYNVGIGRLTNTGDASSISFLAGRILGYALTLPFQVVIGVTNFVTRLWNFANDIPYSKYYYLKPTMPLYWNTVNMLVNKMGVNLGIIEGPSSDDISLTKTGDDNATQFNYSNGLSQSEVNALNKLLPDILRGNGGIDVFAVSTRAQRLAAAHHKKLKSIGEQTLGQGQEAYREAIIDYITREKLPTPRPVIAGDLPSYLNTFYKGGTIGNNPNATDPAAPIESYEDDKGAALGVSKELIANGYDDASMLDYFNAELQDGAAFVTFQVENEGSVGESFNNSTRTSDVADALNGASSGARALNFNLAGGNVGDNVILNTIEGFIGGIKDFTQGLASSVGLGGLSALGGAAFVDVPEFWENATADLPTASYTIKLGSPYGNKLSLLLNVFLPLAMLLAGALPRTTGKNSYTSPFLCRLHSTGRNIIKTGIIESLSITRGTSNVGWSVDQLPTEIEVNLTIKNLSSIMHVPVGELSGPVDLASLSMLDEDTALTDYMAAITGVSLYDQYYFMPKLRLAWANQMADFKSWASPSQFASAFSGTSTGRLMSAFYMGTSR
jgi:hypothetical protein